MCRLEPVEGDSVVTTIDVDHEVLGLSFEHFVGPVVWLLQWFPCSIVANKDVGTRGEGRVSVGCTVRQTRRSSFQLSHVRLEGRDIV